MVISQQFLEEIADGAIALAEQAAGWIGASLADSPIGYARPDDDEFILWFANQAEADLNWVLMLALDDGDNGREILRRYRRIMQVDPLAIMLDMLSPDAAEYVMAKAGGVVDDQTRQEYDARRLARRRRLMERQAAAVAEARQRQIADREQAEKAQRLRPIEEMLGQAIGALSPAEVAAMRGKMNGSYGSISR